ncbi:hypothetical protein [Neobacillus sp. SAB-20_R2A]|uniref:hypothetical protein n=1 Tax=Neobacillus sp. SAB-20_R2A TaxID=3120519 RepID=UPI003C6E25B4
MAEQNYYLLLELEIDPPEHDYDKIKAAIQSKRVHWSRRINNPKFQDEAQANMDLLDNAEREMKDPDIRAKHAKDALEAQQEAIRKIEIEAYERLNRYISVLAQKGVIYEREIDLLETELGLTREQIKKQITIVPIADAEAQTEEAPIEIKEALSKDIMRQINDLLAKLITDQPQWGNVPTLYDLLNLSEKAGLEELYDMAESRTKLTFSKGATSQVTNERNALAHAMRVFKKEELRAQYDEAVKNQRFEPVCDLIKIAGSTGELDPLVYEGLVTQAMNEGLVQSDAEQRIQLFCKREKIRIGKHEEDSQPEKLNLLQCGVCGLVNDDKVSSCRRCGSDLKTICKKCHATSSTADDYCSNCGISFADLRIQEHYLKRAEWALLRNDFDLAIEFVGQARYYWADNEEVKTASNEIEQARSRLKSTLQAVEKLIVERKFYSAEKELIKVKHNYPKNAELAILDRTVKNKINLAEALLNKAGSAANTQEIIQYNMRALEECADCQQAIDNLNRFPPRPPHHLEVKTNMDYIRLDWDSLYKGDNIFYVVERQEGTSGPIKKLAETRYHSFLDKTSEAGKHYFYTIYTVRGSQQSENGSVIGPVMRVGEVGQLRTIAGEEGISLTWKTPAGTKIEIWRKEETIPTEQGDGKKISATTSHEYLDTTVEKDKIYGYLIIAEYVDPKGKPVFSKGTGILATTANRCGCKISIEERSDEFSFQWANPENGTTRLFFAEYPFEKVAANECFLYNRFISGLDGKPIILTEPGVYRINNDFNGILHILPVTQYGDCTVAGEAFMITSIQPVSRVKGRRYENGELLLTWSWPRNAEKVTVSYSEIGFSDPLAQNRECSKTYYDSSGGFKIDHVGADKRFFITILVTEELDGKKYYSNPVQYQYPEMDLAEIGYSLTVKKKWFFLSKRQAFLTIKAPEAGIPDLVVVQQKGRVPNELKDGVVIKRINVKEGKENYVVDLTSHLKDDSYIKLFFVEGNDSEGHSFILKPKGQLKLF